MSPPNRVILAGLPMFSLSGTNISTMHVVISYATHREGWLDQISRFIISIFYRFVIRAPVLTGAILLFMPFSIFLVKS